MKKVLICVCIALMVPTSVLPAAQAEAVVVQDPEPIDGERSFDDKCSEEPSLEDLEQHRVAGPIITPAFGQNAIQSTSLAHNTADVMFEIKQPGRYFLATNLFPNPTNDAVVVIKISASNVILDLNSKTIQTLAGATGDGLTAIAIAPGLSNIIIQNGAINDMCGKGIVAQSGINLASVTINNCVQGGIELVASSAVLIEDVAITNCGSFGLQATQCQDIVIIRSLFNNNGVGADCVAGVLLNGCTDCLLRNVEASSNTGSVGVCGFKVTGASGQSSSVRFIDCIAYGNTASAGFANGFRFVNSSNHVLSRCVASSQQAAGGYSAGFSFDRADASSLVSCSAVYNSAIGEGSQAFGFRFVGAQGNDIALSESLGNAADGDAVYGFYFADATSSYITDSQSINNVSTNSSAHGFFSVAGQGAIFSRCQAQANRAGTQLSATPCPVAGSCNPGLAYACGSNKVIASGFEFRNGEHGSALLDCKSVSNDGGANGVGFGIKFGSLAAGDIVSLATIRNNFIATNVGNFGMYGFKDFTGLQPANSSNPGCTTVLIGNIFYGNGTQEVLKYILNGKMEDRGLAPCGGQNVYLYFGHTPHQDPQYMFTETDISMLQSLSTAPPLGNILMISTSVPDLLPQA